MQEVLALIPARGGSKGIVGKNLRTVAGEPLIVHSIRHAQASRRITRVVVSTDDVAIAEVARSHGAEVPFLRPAEYATDLATDLEVFRHALCTLAATEGYRPELVVHLRPTSPVREPAVVDDAIARILGRPDADSLKSISPVDKSPYKMWRIEAGDLQPAFELEGVPEAHSMPRQMLPETFMGNGYVDIVRPRAVLEQDSMVGRVVLPFLLLESTFDLDHESQIPAIEAALLFRAVRIHREFESSSTP
jgi:N-acylneuraminate cytidylyltransferase